MSQEDNLRLSCRPLDCKRRIIYGGIADPGDGECGTVMEVRRTAIGPLIRVVKGSWRHPLWSVAGAFFGKLVIRN